MAPFLIIRHFIPVRLLQLDSEPIKLLVLKKQDQRLSKRANENLTAFPVLLNPRRNHQVDTMPNSNYVL